MTSTMMQITLYDENSEVKKQITRSFVPWKLLKKAVRLSKSIDAENVSEDDMDALAELVVETFGNQFTVEELNEGADVSEMVAVLQAIVGKAGAAMGNPLIPGK